MERQTTEDHDIRYAQKVIAGAIETQSGNWSGTEPCPSHVLAISVVGYLERHGFEIVRKAGRGWQDILRQQETERRRAGDLGLKAAPAACDDEAGRTEPEDDIARLARTVPLTKEIVSFSVEGMDRAESLAAIHGEDGMDEPRLSDLSWLRDLLRSARNAGAIQALQGDCDDPDAVFAMLQGVEDLYRRLAALTGQRPDIYDSENPQNRGEAA